jgi:hypothetical protein
MLSSMLGKNSSQQISHKAKVLQKTTIATLKYMYVGTEYCSQMVLRATVPMQELREEVQAEDFLATLEGLACFSRSIRMAMVTMAHLSMRSGQEIGNFYQLFLALPTKMIVRNVLKEFKNYFLVLMPSKLS